MIYKFIHEHHYKRTIEMMCRFLKISHNSYYYWLREPKSQCKEQVKVLIEKIQEAYFKAKERYGSPRIKEELYRTGTEVSRTTVAKYMKLMGLKSKTLYKQQTIRLPRIIGLMME